MLDPASDWADKLKNLPPKPSSAVEGNMNFASAIGGLMNKVQAGPTGQPGILTFASPIMAAAMSSLNPPSPGPDWAVKLATAWQSGCLASVITPGTVTLPVWPISGGLDTLTLPAAAATIPTISVAFAALTASLMEIALLFQKKDPSKSDIEKIKKAPDNMAKAFRDATSMFVFICIGLAPPAVPTPVPLSAQ